MRALIKVFTISQVHSLTYLHNQIRIVSSQDEIALDTLSDGDLVELCKRHTFVSRQINAADNPVPFCQQIKITG